MATIFLGGLIEVGIVLGIQNNLKFRDSARVSWPRSFAVVKIKIQLNLFCGCFNGAALHCICLITPVIQFMLYHLILSGNF